MNKECELMTTPVSAPLPAPPPDLLTIQEVSRWLNISVSTVRQWTKLGRLPAPVQLSGRRTRWSEQAIRRHLDRMAQEQ